MSIKIPQFARTATGGTGLVIVASILLIAILGPLIAPHPIDEMIGPAGWPPNADAPLGTDALGRDVLSRVLSGGQTVVFLAFVSTVIAYVIAVLIAAVAGYRRGATDMLLMRGMDILLAFPGLVIVLVLIGVLGNSIPILICGVVLMKVPTIVLIIRSAVLEVTTRGYVEAAIARGESSAAVITREIVPSISPLLLADFGIRFGYTIATIASINFLGLGLTPPAADWGYMVSENRDFLTLNPWAVLIPALLLALLTIGICLVGDAYSRSLTTDARSARRNKSSLMGRIRRAQPSVYSGDVR